MYILFVSTIVFTFLTTVLTTPVSRGFFVPANLTPQILAEIPPHCLQIDADMEACYVSTQTTNDVESDAQKMRTCICANDSFSMEKVTSYVPTLLKRNDIYTEVNIGWVGGIGVPTTHSLGRMCVARS